MPPTTPRRVAIYGWIPSEREAPDVQSELMRLRGWCAYKRHVLAGQYIDHDDGSGRRPERSRLMSDAAQKKFDMVLVWSLDTFDVKGVGPTALDIRRLIRDGVAFHSFMEDHLCTDDPQVHKVLLPVILSFTQLEDRKASKRIKAGLRLARAYGKRLGRAPFSYDEQQQLRAALDTGANWLKVSRTTGIPYSTVKKHARELGYHPPGRGVY